jgi:hypothetical protein
VNEEALAHWGLLRQKATQKASKIYPHESFIPSCDDAT